MEAKMSKFLWVAVISVSVASFPMEIGFGVGPAQGSEGLALGTVSLWITFPLSEPRVAQITGLFLTPLLPAEGPAVALVGGLGVKVGEKVRLSLETSVGLVVENLPQGQPRVEPALGGALGANIALTPNLGLHISAGFLLAFRSQEGRFFPYPYFPLTLGAELRL
jgi:hypothetical protein